MVVPIQSPEATASDALVAYSASSHSVTTSRSSRNPRLQAASTRTSAESVP